jgi:hypothetical protein
MSCNCERRDGLERVAAKFEPARIACSQSLTFLSAQGQMRTFLRIITMGFETRIYGIPKQSPVIGLEISFFPTEEET